MACNCIEKTDEAPKPLNTRLSLLMTFSGEFEAYPVIETEQIARGRGQKKAKQLVPTYCPFCGTRYRDEDAAP